MKWIELVLGQRLLAPPELDRDVVQPARREAAIEMPQSRNDHAHDRHFYVGSRLVEHEKIVARAGDDVYARARLLARVEGGKLRLEIRVQHGFSARRQIGVVLEPEWR